MVSDEPNPGPTPGSAVPTSAPASSAPASGTAAPARRRGRRILLIVAIVVAFLVVLGGTIGVVAYDKATAIDRSNPTVVVRQFMEAAVLDHDSGRVALFVCQSWSASAAMDRTKLPDIASLRVNWGVTSVSQVGNTATAEVRVLLSVPAGGGGSYRDVQPWHFTLADEGGWRVCGVERGPSIN